MRTNGEITLLVALTRLLITLLLAGFSAVVLSSFGYGVHLLFRAEASVRRAARPQPSARDALLAEQLRRAEQERRDGNVEQALLIYRRILAQDPSVPAQLGLAEGELLAGRLEVAAHEFERVLELDPEHPAALLQLGRIYARHPAHWRRAEPHFRTYLSGRPDDAEAQLGLARVLVWQQRPAEAVALYSREGVQRRMDASDQRDYAFALVAARRIAEAEPLLRKLRAARPHDPLLTRQLAGIHASRREWNAALPLYRSLLQRTPGDAQVQLEYGYALVAVGDTAAAITPLAAAARAMPGSREAGLAYARALRSAGEGKAAAREFERILPHYARDASFRREYGDLLLGRRDYREAEGQYREALRLGLRDPRLLAALAGALQANGKAKEAVPLLEEAYARQPSDRLALDLAKLYRNVGRSEDALRLLRRIEADRQRASR